MEKKVLIPIPAVDFDPSETGVPWKILSGAGVKITFATQTGKPGLADPRMLTGRGLGPLARVLAADQHGFKAYEEMNNSSEFRSPIKWDDIKADEFDGVILPGGHAKGMKPYLESVVLQKCVSRFFETEKPVGAICHGVVLAARSKLNGQSVLFNKKTTALLASQEILAWLLTFVWLGSYYRTYPRTVESEVKSVLSSKSNFIKGPMPIARDEPSHLEKGFVVQDGNYLSARWPGDAHLFSNKFLALLSS